MQHPGALATPSSSGLLIACIVERHLRVRYTRVPEQYIDFSIWCPPQKIRYLTWANDSSRVLVFSSAYVEIVNLENDKQRVRIENGTGGVGRFEAAEFLDPENVITIWEYGRAKIWNLSSGRTRDIENTKTLTSGRAYGLRTKGIAKLVAYLSRPAAEDLLGLCFDDEQSGVQTTSLPTVDAQSITWSPSGDWLAILDAPQYSPGLFLFTADGHFFRSFPPTDRRDSDITGLGIKQAVWSPDSQYLAVSSFGSHLELIAAKTLSPVARIEHSTLIERNTNEAIVWQEHVSGSGARSYSNPSTPITIPLSTKASTGKPTELGIASVLFDCSGAYLATIDSRMHSTVWIWDVESMRLRGLLIRHTIVKSVMWHGQIPGLILLDSGDNVACSWSISSQDPPVCISAAPAPSVSLCFVPGRADSAHPIILASSKDTFQLLYPFGRDSTGNSDGSDLAEGDSIFEALSGREASSTTDLSHTQRIAFEAELDDGTARMDDTFRLAKKKAKDPLDDSDIF